MSVEEPESSGFYEVRLSRAGKLRVFKTPYGYYREVGGPRMFTWGGLRYGDELISIEPWARAARAGEGPGFDANGSPVW